MRDYFKLLTGLAGECAVMKELCLRGWSPSMTYNNCPTIDILCFNPEMNRSVAIQVKTVREKQDGKKIYAFPVMGNRDKRHEFYKEIAGPYVFVYIDKDNNFSYYILSKEQFVAISSKLEDDYDNLPRKKPLAPGSPMAMTRSCLTDYENKWENLWL